jgi:hypothetical protein
MYIIMDVESMVVKSLRVEPQRSGVERWGPEAALPHMGAFSDGLTMASIDLTKSMINLDKGEGRRRLEHLTIPIINLTSVNITLTIS